MRPALEANLTEEPGTGGPGDHTSWLSTIDTDGRPHMTAVGAFWVDGRYDFCGGARSRKIRNVERDPSAGPPPWFVYEFTLEDADAVATTEPGGATRWTC